MNAERNLTASVETDTSESDNANMETELEQKTILWEAPNGELLYAEDGVCEGDIIAFDMAFYRPSTGTYYDSLCEPYLFDGETNKFLGEQIEFDESKFLRAQSGDIINGYTVERAQLLFSMSEKCFLSNSILFKDNVTLKGKIRCFNYDEPTDIQKGDILFIPDSSYENMPLMQLADYNGAISYNGFPAVYSDTMWISMGNLFWDYSDNREIHTIFNGGADSMELRAEVVISGLKLEFASEMGTAGTFGNIVSVNEIL